MNFLFYVGIIVPTVITIGLFIIFIYCWFLQKARKEVLTKKYDPHGKMRRLGLSMNPPPPPRFCLVEDVIPSDVGEDNVAYDVSRSPSSHQDGRGRSMYHTYHDSGISAGLSPSQEHEPRQGLVYRTCPDSGVSGLSLFQPTQTSYHHITRGCCQTEQVLQRQPQLQHVYEDHVDTLQYQQYQQQQSPHVVLNRSLVQASVHLNHGVSCSKNTNHSTTSDLYDLPLIHPTSLLLNQYNEAHDLQTSAKSIPVTTHDPKLSPHQDHAQADSYTPNCNFAPCNKESPVNIHCDTDNMAVCFQRQPSLDNIIFTLPSVNSHLQHPVTPGTDTHLYDLPFSTSPTMTTAAAVETAAVAASPMKQSYRDSGVMDVENPTYPGTERPDSQASQSSTTDSEDSGFRSSYCAPHHKSVLTKQEHPLLKPLRKAKRSKNHSKASRKAISNSQNHPADIRKLFITINPSNLERTTSNTSVIDKSLTNREKVYRPLAVRQQCTNVVSNAAMEGDCQTVSSQDVVELACYNNSPTDTLRQSPTCHVWARQSNDEREMAGKQTINLTDISTHLSWKYLSGVPPCSSNPETEIREDSGSLDGVHQNCTPGQSVQAGRDSHLDIYGYSVV